MGGPRVSELTSEKIVYLRRKRKMSFDAITRRLGNVSVSSVRRVCIGAGLVGRIGDKCRACRMRHKGRTPKSCLERLQ